VRNERQRIEMNASQMGIGTLKVGHMTHVVLEHGIHLRTKVGRIHMVTLMVQRIMKYCIVPVPVTKK
jgi:hypothetical protein